MSKPLVVMDGAVRSKVSQDIGKLIFGHSLSELQQIIASWNTFLEGGIVFCVKKKSHNERLIFFFYMESLAPLSPRKYCGVFETPS
jgi:hypothetical protein